MSRAYTIRVRECIQQVIRAEDGVSAQLEILEILPAVQMAGLLAAELEERGFERDGEHLTRKQDGGIVVTVDPKTGTVTVRAESADEVVLEGEKKGQAYSETGDSADAARAHLREELQQELKGQVRTRADELQEKVTEQLEAELCNLRQELDQAVNRATAAALKQKAAQLGQIKEMTEDPQTGSLTIVVEV